MIAAVILIVCTPLAAAKDEAMARIQKEQEAIERVLEHPELWRVAHRRRQAVHERYWILEPPPRGDATADKDTVLSLPGITVGQAGRLLALYAEEEELHDLDRAQRRRFIARINGGELGYSEDRRARALLQAIDDDTRSRTTALQERIHALLSKSQRAQLERVPPRMSPRAREIAYEGLLALEPRLLARWEAGRRLRRMRMESSFPMAMTIANHCGMGLRLEELGLLARQVVERVPADRIAVWIQEPAPAAPQGKGVAIWLVSPHGLRSFSVGALRGTCEWRNTLYRPGHLTLPPGEHELRVRVEQQDFTAKVQVRRATRAIYILAQPTGVRAVTVAKQ